MSTNIESITDRLIYQADAELKKQCDDAGHDLYNLICDGAYHDIEVNVDGKTVKVDYCQALKALRSLAFRLRCEHQRQNKIDAFMQKVDGLANEVEELRQSITP